MDGHQMPAHGSFGWTEIASGNLEKCKSFYANVFGWNYGGGAAAAEGGMEYAEFRIGDTSPMGGIYEISRELCGEGELPPPHFVNYIVVDDVHLLTTRAFDLGATIIRPPMPVSNVGTMSMIKDPAGAMIAFITLDGGGN